MTEGIQWNWNLPTPGTLSAEEALQRALATRDGFHKQLDATTKVLIGLIETAGDVRHNKLHGCDRCSECTIKLSAIVENWLQTPPFSCADMMVINLHRFAGFPRALLKLIPACLRFVDTARQKAGDGVDLDIEGILINRLESLCELANKAFHTGPDEFLCFCRLARVLELTRPAVARILSKTPGWPSLECRFDEVMGLTNNVETHLRAETFHELHEPTKTPPSWQKRWKRVCGGGHVREEARPGYPNPDPMLVVDFSRDHILAIVKDELLEKKTRCTFIPCQRELSFQADPDVQKAELDFYSKLLLIRESPLGKLLSMIANTAFLQRKRHLRRIGDLMKWAGFRSTNLPENDIWVFGHTHMTYQYAPPHARSALRLFDLGGWIVEHPIDPRGSGWPIPQVFYWSPDKGPSLVSVELLDSEKEAISSKVTSITS